MIKTNKTTSNDRRITVLPALWPKLQQFAERDGLSVAHVVNAILLQNIQPYSSGPHQNGTGTSCAALHSLLPAGPTSFVQGLPHGGLSQQGMSQQPDPYETSSIDSW